LHKKIKIFGCIPLVIITVIILFSLTVQAEDRYKGTFNPGDSLRFQSPFKDNHKSKIQSKLKKNTHQKMPLPILIDPRNTSIVESGSLGVNVRLLEGEEPWVSYFLSATQWDWKVRKPGNYAGKCLVGKITSNVDVVIHFEGFEDLSSTNSPTQNLETYYSATLFDLTIDQMVWKKASDFNAHDLIIPQSPIDPIYWSLWNKVSVKNNISAGEYSDDAFVTFVILNTKTWTDPEIPTGP